MAAELEEEYDDDFDDRRRERGMVSGAGNVNLDLVNRITAAATRQKRNCQNYNQDEGDPTNHDSNQYRFVS